MKKANSNVYQSQSGHHLLELTGIEIISKSGKPNLKDFMMLNMLLMVSLTGYSLVFVVMNNLLIKNYHRVKNFISILLQNSVVQSLIGSFVVMMKVTFLAHLMQIFHFHLNYIHHHYLWSPNQNLMSGALYGMDHGKIMSVYMHSMNSYRKKIKMYVIYQKKKLQQWCWQLLVIVKKRIY